MNIGEYVNSKGIYIVFVVLGEINVPVNMHIIAPVGQFSKVDVNNFS